MACARIGSAVLFAAAAAIGAAPSTTTASAVTAATDCALAVATVLPERRSAPAPRHRTASVRQPLRRSPAVDVSSTSAGLRGDAGSAPGNPPRSAAGNGIMLFGSVPSPPKKPKSWTSTQSARQNTTQNHIGVAATSRASAGEEDRPDGGERDDRDEVDREARCSRRTCRRPTAATERKCGCGVEAIDWTIAASGPGWPCSVPCQKPRPGQACSTAMPMKKTPSPPSSSRPNRGAPPGALGQRDQRPRHDVEQHRPGRAEQPAQPGREDPAERLAEHPHDQPPAHAGQPGQPGPTAPGPRKSARRRCRPGSIPRPRPPGWGDRPRSSRPS